MANHSTQAANPVLEAVLESVSGLLSEYGSTLDQCTPCSPFLGGPSPTVSAIVGFTGEAFKGSLALLAPPRMIADLVPDTGCDPTDVEIIRDWIGELANQLLGRAKNKMVRLGASFSMSPPTTIVGTNLDIVSSGTASTGWYRVSTSTSQMFLMCDFRGSKDFVLRPREEPDDNVADEGEVMLF